MTPVSPEAVTELQRKIPRLFADVRMEAFVYGNLKNYPPLKLAMQVSNALPFRNDTLQRNVCPRSQARVRKLPTSKASAIRLPEFNPKERNSAYVAIFQLGLRSINDDVLSSLLNRMIAEPFYYQLRTKEQVGYLLHTARSTFHGTSSILLAVQSPRLSAAALDTRVEEFLDDYYAQLKQTTPASLQAHINAEVSTLKAPWTHSEAEASARWSEIKSQQYVFDRRDKEVQALQRLALADLLQMYETKIMSGGRGSHHRKLSVQLFGAGQPIPESKDSASEKDFESVHSLESLIDFASNSLSDKEEDLFPPMAHKNPSVADKWNQKAAAAAAAKQQSTGGSARSNAAAKTASDTHQTAHK